MVGSSRNVAALILAAGRSTRMGVPKMALPVEGGQALIAYVVSIFKASGADPVFVVTGAHRDQVEAAVAHEGVLLVHNQDFNQGGMLRSVKVGLRAVERSPAGAVLVCPGDMPALERATLEALIAAWEGGAEALYAPSFQTRRGHPLLIGRAHWDEIQKLPQGSSLRDYLKSRERDVGYVVVQDSGIVQDLDTPEDYRDLRGGTASDAG